jgi:hypothetical protein
VPWEITHPTPLNYDPNQLVQAEITYQTPLDYDPNQFLDHDHDQLEPWEIAYPTSLNYDPNQLVPSKIANPTPLYDDPNQLVPVEITYTYPTSLDYDPNQILPLEITYQPQTRTFEVQVPSHALETIKLFFISGLISDRKTIKTILTFPQDVAEKQFQSVIDISINHISKHSTSEWEQYKMPSEPSTALVKEPPEPSEPPEPLEPLEPLESSESSEPHSNPRYIIDLICNEISNFYLFICSNRFFYFF